MSFTYENQGTNTYMVYEISNNDVIDSMSLGMLTNNKIPGLAPALFTQMDAKKYIKYNVSAKVSVKQFFEGQVNKKRLLGVFDGIVNAMLSAEEYMIDTNTILLDLNYIFTDVSTCDTILICLPVERNSESTDLATFFKTIMFSTQFDQTENCDHVARIINYLNSAIVFSLSEFKSLLDSIKSVNNAPSKVATQPTVQPATPVQQKPVQQQPAVQPQPVAPVQKQVVAQQPVQTTVQKTTPKKNNNMQQAASPVTVPPTSSVPTSQLQGKTEKKISMFGLLMHYNKENKRLYQAQKAEKKAAKSNTVSTSAPAQSKKSKTSSSNFAVPGAPTNTSFAIPGQSSTPIKPQSQSVQSIQRPVAPRVQTQQQSQQQLAQQGYTPIQQTPQGQAANFGETTVLGGGTIGETTVLGDSTPDVQNTPHLIRTKNNERINLDKPVFRIGKEKSYVDYFVSDNTAVSRSHANIISRDGQYYIVDTNSTNHTYVNGGMIQSNVETPLSHGAKIRLANEDFEFKLY